MLDIIFIGLSLFLIIIFSYLIGNFILLKFDLDLSKYIKIPLGFFIFLGLLQFLVYFIVYFKIPTFFLYLLIIFLILFLSFLTIKYVNFKDFKIDKIYLFAFFYLGIMIIISSQRTLGNNGFDSIYYLNIVIHDASSVTSAYFNYNSGTIIDHLNVTYDYQVFYLFASFFVYLYNQLQVLISPSFIKISSHIYIWLFSCLYFLLNFFVIVSIIDYLKIKNTLMKLFFVLLTLVFFSNQYYNTAFAFFGNTYRTLIVVLVSIDIHYLVNSGYHRNKFIILSILSSSLIAVSSSGFFIAFMMIYSFISILLIDNKKDVQFIDILILVFPIIEFAFFFQITWILNHFFISIGLLFILFFFYILIKKINISKIVFLILIPISIVIISIYLNVNSLINVQSFFTAHSTIDMVWDSFNLLSFKHLFINSIILCSLIYFLIFNKNNYRKYLWIIIVSFINPISYLFVSKYLASIVYYRSFEIVFNSFTYLLMINYISSNIEKFNYSNILKLSIIFILSTLGVQQIQSYYHQSFRPSDDFSPLYKMETNQVDVLNVLNTKRILEDHNSPKVISQIETMVGYVPNIKSVISYGQYRAVNRYDYEHEYSKLLNIFILREYYNQPIFIEDADYEHTCEYLIEEKVDFVIVDNRQYYIKDGEFIPLYIRVRDCASEVYKNEKYTLYQFYWN